MFHHPVPRKFLPLVGLDFLGNINVNYHGYGMLSIRRVVEKYGGSFSIFTEDQLFQIEIILPIPASALDKP